MATRPNAVPGRFAVFVTTVAALALAGCASDKSSGSLESESPVPTSSPSPSSSPSEASNDLIMDVPIGDRRIHVTCFGPQEAGVPTVLLEAGAGEPSDTWDGIVDTMAEKWRMCSYDRAGLGASPPAPEARRTNKDLVDDLEATLAGADIEGPFVLVGHSMAIWPLAVFTDRHRDDVAGVVLVDPRAPDVSARFLAALPPQRADEPDAVRAWREDDLGTFEHDPSQNPEHLDLARTAAEASALLDPPGAFFDDVPLVVLSASRTKSAWADLPAPIRKAFDRAWLEEQRSLVDESSDGSFQEVDPSGHSIQLDQPQAVVDAIESVLTAAS